MVDSGLEFPESVSDAVGLEHGFFDYEVLLQTGVKAGKVKCLEFLAGLDSFQVVLDSVSAVVGPVGSVFMV